MRSGEYPGTPQGIFSEISPWVRNALYGLAFAGVLSCCGLPVAATAYLNDPRGLPDTLEALDSPYPILLTVPVNETGTVYLALRETEQCSNSQFTSTELTPILALKDADEGTVWVGTFNPCP